MSASSLNRAWSFLLPTMAVCMCSVADAQPTRQVDAGVMVAVPWRVMVDPNGSARLETCELGPVPADDLRQILPTSVPVFTVENSGLVRPGAYVRNDSNDLLPTYSGVYPWFVQYDAETGYSVVTGEIVTAGPCFGATLGEFGLAPHSTRLIERSEWVSIRYARGGADRGGGPRGDWQIVWLDADQIPSHKAEIAIILDSVATRFQRVLNPSAGQARIRLQFENLGAGGGRAITSVNVAIRSPGGTQQALIAQAARDQAAGISENAEELLYTDSFPDQATVPVRFDVQNTAQVPKVRLPSALAGQLGHDAGPNEDAFIKINTYFMDANKYDYTAENGIDEGASDFEYMLTHEVVHALGFNSQTELAHWPGEQDRIFLFDLFRFSSSAFPNKIVSSPFFKSTFRFPAWNEPAFTATAVGTATFSYHMSMGGKVLPNDPDGLFESPHWLVHTDPGAGQYFGLMDPLQEPNTSAQVPGYMFQSDWRALDVIGWPITTPVQNPEPPKPPPQLPPDGQQGVSRTPTIEWTSGAGIDSVTLYIYRDGVVSPSTLVLAQSGLTGTSFSVPAGVLDFYTVYKWFLTSYNSFGWTLGDSRTFQTACLADFNLDGFVDGIDYDEFNAAFENSDPVLQMAADMNGDGFVDGIDYDLFNYYFETGCW